MPKTVSVNIPSLRQGAPVEVLGLGVFKNGTKSEVSDEKIEEYKNQGYTVPEGDFVFPAPKDDVEENLAEAPTDDLSDPVDKSIDTDAVDTGKKGAK